MNPCQPVDDSLFPDIFFLVFSKRHLCLRRPRNSGQETAKKTHTHTFDNCLAGTHKTRVCAIIIYLQKTAWTFDFLCGKYSVICIVAWQILCFSIKSTLGVEPDSVLSVQSQVVDFFREIFYRHALDYYLRSAHSERKWKPVFLLKRLTVTDLFEGMWSVVTRLRC